jgi:hypothetical protein
MRTTRSQRALATASLTVIPVDCPSTGSRDFSIIGAVINSLQGRERLKSLQDEVVKNLVKEYKLTMEGLIINGEAATKSISFNVIYARDNGMLALGASESALEPADIVGLYQGTLKLDDDESQGSNCCFSVNSIPGLEGFVIDANASGSLMRFINHSCSPNCVVRVLMSSRYKVQLVVVAEETILPSQTLTIDYGWPTATKKDTNRMKCLCGAPKCRGDFLERRPVNLTAFAQAVKIKLGMSESVQKGLNDYLTVCYLGHGLTKTAAFITASGDSNWMAVVLFMQQNHAVNNIHLSLAVKLFWSSVNNRGPSPFTNFGFKVDRSFEEDAVFKKYKLSYDQLLLRCNMAS